MAVQPHVTSLGAKHNFARGGACGLCPNRSCVGAPDGERHRGTAPRPTNRLARQGRGVGNGELSRRRYAVHSIRGNPVPRWHGESNETTKNKENVQASAFGQTLRNPWPTPGVYSKVRLLAVKGRSVDSCNKVRVTIGLQACPSSGQALVGCKRSFRIV